MSEPLSPFSADVRNGFQKSVQALIGMGHSPEQIKEIVNGLREAVLCGLVWEEVLVEFPQLDVPPPLPPLSNTPWTVEQVESLNDYQRCGMCHPYTCGKNHPGNRDLVATRTGWVCEVCDYRQAWASETMMDGSWRKMFDNSPLHRAIEAARKAREAGA